MPEPASAYQPSGRVALAAFLCLGALVLVVAALMAEVLLLAEAQLYYYIITPILLSLPVMLATLCAVRFGQCRHPRVGLILGLVASSVFYGGYWLRSYQYNVARHGPQAVESVEQVTGWPGMAGYFVYRCGNTAIDFSPVPSNESAKPSPLDRYFNYMLFGAEMILLLLFGGLCAQKAAGCVYSERLGRWSWFLHVNYALQNPADMVRLVQTCDWPALAGMTRMPAGETKLTQSASLRFEYIPGFSDEPVYVSLVLTIMNKNTEKPAGYWPGMALLRQVQVDPASLPALFETLPELKQAIAKKADAAPSLAGLFKPAAQNEAADTWQALVEESNQALKQVGAMTPPLKAGLSLCLDVPTRSRLPLRAVIGPSAPFILMYLVGFIGGLALLALGTDTQPHEAEQISMPGWLLIVPGGALTMLSLYKLIAMLCAMNGSRARRLLNRADAWIRREKRADTLYFQLEDARTFLQAKLFPEDLVLCLVDNAEKRLILEGCLRRYLIYGRDVTALENMETASAVAIKLNCRIGKSTMNLVLSQPSVLRRNSEVAARICEGLGF